MAEMDDPGAVLDAIQRHYSDRLSTWETDFIENVQSQWDEFHALSERQRTKLGEIFEKVSAGGRDGGASARR